MQVLTNGHIKLANIFIDFKDFMVHLDIFPGLYSMSPILHSIVYFLNFKRYGMSKASYSIL